MAKRRKSYRAKGSKPARRTGGRKARKTTRRKSSRRSGRAAVQKIVIQMPGERLNQYPSLSPKRKVF